MAGESILQAWGHANPKTQTSMWEAERERERERERGLWLLFLYAFSSPLGLPFVNWASQECYLFSLRSSLRSSDLPFFYFFGLFPSLSSSHCHLDSCFLLYLPNTCTLSRFSRVRLCATPRTAAHRAPLPTGLSRQEYWSGLPFPFVV